MVATGAAVDTVDVGQRVQTMMQGLGGVRSVRPGGYQEYVTVEADVVAPVPMDVDPLAAAALGLAAVTAHQGLSRIGDVGGRRIAVTGAAGGVGSAAVSLAAANGAEVVVVVRNAGGAEHLLRLGAAQVIDDVSMIPARSLDGVLDTVAGSLFESLVLGLADGGTLSLVGAVAGGRVTFDAWELIRGLQVTGYSSEDLDGSSLRSAMAGIFPLVRVGTLAPPPWQVFPLSAAADAHRLLESGGVRGRVLLVTSSAA